MGGSKKQTVGYKYFVGMHHVLCHGPADAVMEIKVDDKQAWTGYNDGTEQISIVKPDLFGGDKREGGIAGNIDILLGDPDQEANSYLENNILNEMDVYQGKGLYASLKYIYDFYEESGEGSPTAIVPAFRGVCSAVLHRMYVGLNPYLKPWKWKVSRIHKTDYGVEQWYDEKAAIGIPAEVALYFAIDISSSMNTVTSNGKTRLENMKFALEAALTPLLSLTNNADIDFMVVAFAETAVTITRRGVDGSDIQDIIDWINARENSDVVNGTNFETAIGYAPDYFDESGTKRRVSIFITDGWTLDGSEIPAGIIFNSISDLTGYGINIDLEDTSDTAYLDNTPLDGIPVVSGSESTELEQAVINAMFAQFDMNAAHIIRECLNSGEWGLGYPAADIDSDGTFTDAADTLFDEGMGISILWDKETSIEDFIATILQHIDGTLYVDRSTGKFCLKLVRDDYDEESLIELDESNVLRLENFKRSTMSDLYNEVIVKYWDGNEDKIKTIPLQNIALIQAMGRVVSITLDYPGFSNFNIANRIALRDLITLSAPRMSGTIFVNRQAFSLNPGDCFKFSWSDYGVSSVIMRITSMSLGGPTNNEIKIDFTQDTFATPDIVLNATEGLVWGSQGGSPAAPAAKTAFELPYMALVKEQGEDDINTRLDSVPEASYIGAAAVRPNTISINAEIHTDSGEGYVEYGNLDFCPSATLAAAIDYKSEEITIENDVDADLVESGTWGQIDDELVVIDAIDEDAGTATIRRGILDTVPAKHEAGARLYIWEDYTAGDGVEYVDSEEIDIKLLTVTGGGVLDIEDATEDTVTMDSRAIRPYPPGNLQINSESYLFDVYYGELTVSWAHRDRLQQTSGTYQDYTYGDIGPEDGVTYTFKGYIDDVIDDTQTDIATTSTTWTPSSEGLARVEVIAVRDTYESWQAAAFEFDYCSHDVRITEDDNVRGTEDGDGRSMEE